MKRHLIQFLTAIGTNSYFQGFIDSKIYTGDSKYVCVPGMNCYSCPGAVGACPIGSLQAVIGSRKFNLAFYVVGFMALFGTIFGRVVCGFLCAFGFFQDLLYKIPTPKLRIPHKIDQSLRWVKYGLLLFAVILLPMFLTNKYGIASPYYCQYVCPVGTLEGGVFLVFGNESLKALVGLLFAWKMFILVGIILMSIFVYRPFCKFLCPLGAFYGFFNSIGIVRMTLNTDTCTRCGICERTCNMQVPVLTNVNHRECIRCGDCITACPQQSIEMIYPFKKDLSKNKEITK